MRETARKIERKTNTHMRERRRETRQTEKHCVGQRERECVCVCVTEIERRGKAFFIKSYLHLCNSKQKMQNPPIRGRLKCPPNKRQVKVTPQ